MKLNEMFLFLFEILPVIAFRTDQTLQSKASITTNIIKVLGAYDRNNFVHIVLLLVHFRFIPCEKTTQKLGRKVELEQNRLAKIGGITGSKSVRKELLFNRTENTSC